MPTRIPAELHPTDRDLAMLRLIGEHYIVRLDVLHVALREYSRAHLLDGASPIKDVRLRELLPRWQEPAYEGRTHAQLVVTKPYGERLIGDTGRRLSDEQSTWIYLTRHGYSAAGLPYDAWTPMRSDRLNTSQWPHYHYILLARRYLEQRYAAELAVRPWLAERELRWRQGLPEGDVGIPDGELHLDDGTVAAIEVEVTPKHADELRAKLLRLFAHYAAITFYVPRPSDTWTLVQRIRADMLPESGWPEEDWEAFSVEPLAKVVSTSSAS